MRQIGLNHQPNFTQLAMNNEQNKPIEIIPSTPIYPDLHQIKHLDSTHLIDTTLVLVTLLTSIINLLKYIKKILKQRKCDPKLLLQIVGMILAIVKAIGQMGEDELDREDE
jgi:hypothetical protein